MTKFIPLTITLLDPVIITGDVMNPNEVSTLNYLTGSTLRGAAYAAARGHALHSLTIDPRVSFLPAYLNVGDHAHMTRGLPTPLSWQRRKNEVVDAADARYSLDIADRPFEPQFFASSPTGYRCGVPGASARLHHARDRLAGAPTGSDGAVFTYRSIAEGTVLTAMVRCEDDAVENLVDLLADIANASVWELGRRHTLEYGRVRVSFAHDAGHVADASWEGGDTLQVRHLEAGHPHLVLLTSPVALRDPASGTFRPDQLPHAVGGAFGGRLLVQSSCVGATTVRTFNSLNGLPSRDILAAAPGSVVSVRSSEAIESAELQRIVAAGLGGYQFDGLGAFVVLDAFGASGLPVTGHSPPRSRTATPTAPMSDWLARAQRRVAYDEARPAMLARLRKVKVTPPASKSATRRLIALLDLPTGDILPAIGYPTGRPLFADSFLKAISQAKVHYTVNRAQAQVGVLPWLGALLALGTGEIPLAAPVPGPDDPPEAVEVVAARTILAECLSCVSAQSLLNAESVSDVRSQQLAEPVALLVARTLLARMAKEVDR